jgi:hypothetical protein
MPAKNDKKNRIYEWGKATKANPPPTSKLS